MKARNFMTAFTMTIASVGICQQVLPGRFPSLPEPTMKTAIRSVLKAHGFSDLRFVNTNHETIVSERRIDLNGEAVIAWAKRVGAQHPFNAWALVR
jgi:hypothetical protein